MKHLSLCVTVLVLGALPLAAAAFDYGPNRTLLAVETGAPQLPTAQARGVALGAIPKPDVAETAGTAEATPAVPQVAPTEAPGAAVRPERSSSASNKPHTRITKPAPAPSPASWQSLLPGSIQ